MAIPLSFSPSLRDFSPAVDANNPAPMYPPPPEALWSATSVMPTKLKLRRAANYRLSKI
jgi:hypothetical protein